MTVSWGPDKVQFVESFKNFNKANTQTKTAYHQARRAARLENPKDPSVRAQRVQADRARMDRANAELKAEKDAAARQAATSPSKIILITIGAMLFIQQLAGMSFPFGLSAWQGIPGYPDQGDDFRDGSQQFTEAHRLLSEAVADPKRWDGDAAHIYNEANATLMGLAQTMANLDLEIAAIVKDQADWVTQTQLGLGITQDILIVALPVVFSLESNFATFWTAYWLAIAAAVGAIGAAIGLLGNCLGRSVENAQTVDGLTTQYEDVAAKAALAPTTDIQENVAAAEQSTVSGFADISGTPTVASSAGLASDSGAKRAPRSAVTGDGQRFGVDSPEVSTPRDETAPSAPALTMPTVAEVRQWSGQAANLSGSSSPRSNRVGQRGAPEEALRAGDIEDAGALGAEGAERAPIDVAAPGPEAVREPSPAERVL